MSLSFETTSATAELPTFTAGRMYMQYAVSDLASHRNANESLLDSPFFAQSIELTRAWQLEQTEGVPIDNQRTQDAILELPHDRTVDVFYRNTLHTALALVTNRYHEVDETTIATARIDEAERALDVRDALYEKETEPRSPLRPILGAACVNALLNRRGFAMPPMPHQSIDYRNNPHAGVLLRQGDHTLHTSQRYDVMFNCGGFAEGHDSTNQKSLLGQRFKRVRLLSVCCDLRLITEDGRTDLPDILDALESDLEGTASPGDRALLDLLGDRLATTITGDESRKGIRATARQAVVQRNRLSHKY